MQCLVICLSPQVCVMACVKLHSLLQTVLCLSWEEVCFLLGRLGAPLWPSGVTDGTNSGHAETFSQLVPIVRTLLDQHADPVILQKLLPNLPITNGSATFAQDLQTYCHTLEWQGFYQHQVTAFQLHPHTLNPVSLPTIIDINSQYLPKGTFCVKSAESIFLSLSVLFKHMIAAPD